MRWPFLAICSLAWTVVGPTGSAAEDLGICRVVTRSGPGKPSGHFTATHIGDGLLLTCGHCCIYAGGVGSVVDVKILSQAERAPYRSEAASVVCFKESADVGLIRLDRADALTVAYRLAPQDYPASTSTAVVQYTWSVPGGTTLRSVRSAVTGANSSAGSVNIESRHAPVQGDSGAPLVSQRDGYIIGVTTGADLWGRFGVHAGTAAIYELLQRCDVDIPSRAATGNEKGAGFISRE